MQNMRDKNQFDVVAVGLRLKQIRKSLKLTIGELSKATGLSVSGISEMESGNKKPSSVYMFGLAKEFKVNVNWILTGMGTMFAPDIELDLDFGQDNDLVRELILSIKNINIARFDILKYFANFKRENQELLKEALKEKECDIDNSSG